MPQNVVHSSHSYAVFNSKTKNWQEVDILWIICLKTNIISDLWSCGGGQQDPT